MLSTMKKYLQRYCINKNDNFTNYQWSEKEHKNEISLCIHQLVVLKLSKSNVKQDVEQ